MKDLSFILKPERDHFLTNLTKLLLNCNFKEQTDEFIHDNSFGHQ